MQKPDRKATCPEISSCASHTPHIIQKHINYPEHAQFKYRSLETPGIPTVTKLRTELMYKTNDVIFSYQNM